ncbi:MAG: GlsB/YeaQ/YmgE family stress response membrane protein [Phycisphaerales bacterium JB039]
MNYQIRDVPSTIARLATGVITICLAGVALAQEAGDAEAQAEPRAAETMARDAIAAIPGDLEQTTLNEIAAWAVIGLLAGTFAGALLAMRRKGYGPVGNILLGMIGAVIGGLIVDQFGLDFGLGGISFSYEELIAAVICAMGLVFILRIPVQQWQAAKKARKAGGAKGAQGPAPKK